MDILRTFSYFENIYNKLENDENSITSKEVGYEKLVYKLFKECDLTKDILCNLKIYITKYFQDRQNLASENYKKHDNYEYVVIKGDVKIGKNVTIEPFTTIEGPVIICDGVSIGTNVHIRPYTIIGDNVSIGHASEIKHAIILNEAKVASFVFVGDSILGYKARIGSGTILANRRFDQANISIKDNGEKINLDTDFFGAVVGDNSRVGANNTLLPGTHVGMHTYIMPGQVIIGSVASDKLVTENGTFEKDRRDLR